MSLEAITWAYKTTVGSSAQKAVLLVLANYADENDSAYPGIPRIAAMTELSERTVQRAVADLEESGVIRVVRKVNSVNRYHLDLGWCQAVTTPGDTVSGGGDTVASDTKKNLKGDTNTPVARRATPAGRAYVGKKSGLRATFDDGAELEALGATKKPTDLGSYRTRRKLSTVTVVARFADDALEAASVPVAQRDTQKGALGTWVKKQRGQGVTLEEIAEAARIFFLDPRGYVAADEPLWKAFINRFPTLHGRATAAIEREQRAAVDHTDYEKEQETWIKASEFSL